MGCGPAARFTPTGPAEPLAFHSSAGQPGERGHFRAQGILPVVPRDRSRVSEVFSSVVMRVQPGDADDEQNRQDDVLDAFDCAGTRTGMNRHVDLSGHP